VTVEDATLRQQLKSFGLSDKEVDTYVSLLGHGEAKASVIAESAGVSKRYVYNVLGTFEERGLVEVNDLETPTTVRAVEPSRVIDQFTDRLSSLEDRLEAEYDPEPRVERRYEVLKSTSTVRKRIQTLLRQAENEVTLSVPASLVPEIAGDLEATLNRGVLTVVLVTEDESWSGDVAAFDGLGSVVRYWEEMGPTFATVDRREGLFSPQDVVTGAETDQQAISFTEDQLSPVVVGSFLGNYWPVAEQVYVHEPTELPVTYDRFRHAVFDATLHERRGRDLLAEVSVRPARSVEEYRTVQGRIVAVNQGLVEPTNNSIPIEHSFVIDDGEERFTVAGPGAFMEDYEATSVTIDAMETASETVTEMVATSSRLGEDGDQT